MFVKRTLTTAVAVGSILVCTFGSATAAPPTAEQQHRLTVLPGCAVTQIPSVGSGDGPTCLVADPSASMANPVVYLFEHGPYGSSDQIFGARIGVASSGYATLPPEWRNRASSWASTCTPGILYANGGGAGDAAGGFGPREAGNFPHGAVGNDDVETVYTFHGC